MPQAGYIMMHIWGSGFMGGTDYRCKINQNAAIEATYDPPSDSIKCWSDLWIDGTNYVEVTLNGREYTSDGHHTEINQFWFDERYNSYEHTNSARRGHHLWGTPPVDTPPVVPGGDAGSGDFSSGEEQSGSGSGEGCESDHCERARELDLKCVHACREYVYISCFRF